MKKYFGLLILIILFTGCEEKAKCDCTAYGVGFEPAAKETVFCHAGKTITPANPSNHGQTHDDGTTCFVGSCDTLGLDDYTGLPYSSDCKDDGKIVTIEGVHALVVCTDKE
jgi:hypothetical protein